MAIGRTERALWHAALNSAEATIGALNALEHLARDFNQGFPEDLLALAEQARKLQGDIEEALNDAL